MHRHREKDETKGAAKDTVKYIEAMPITSLTNVCGRVLVAGGGGNKLFGLPNMMYLLDSARNVLDSKLVHEPVVGCRLYKDTVVVEYYSACGVYRIQDDKIVQIGNTLHGASSLIIADSCAVYIRDSELYYTPLSEMHKERRSSEEKAEREAKEGRRRIAEEMHKDNVRSTRGGHASNTYEHVYRPHMLKDNDKVLQIVSKTQTEESTSENGSDSVPIDCTGTQMHTKLTMEEEAHTGPCADTIVFVVQRGTECVKIDSTSVTVVEGTLSAHTNTNKFGYIVQMAKEQSLLCMMNESDKEECRIEARCTCIHSTDDNAFLVGDGDGYVTKYKNGIEVWKKKVFKSSPVSSVCTVGSVVMCSSISGRLVSVKDTKAQSTKVLGAIVLVGVTLISIKGIAEMVVKKIST